MKPAYQLRLSQRELAQLGELTAIMGQVDDLMVQTVAYLLKVDRPAANVIMGSSKVGDNVEIWANVIRNRTTDEDIIWLIELAVKEFPDVSRGRNDFIHAVFSDPMQMVGGVAVFGGPEDGSATPVMTPMGPMMVSRRPPVSRRVRNKILRPVSDLPLIIDQAAQLSCLIAHIDHLIVGNPTSTSSWLERLGPTLPPRLDTAAERKAKARRGRRKPSPQ